MAEAKANTPVSAACAGRVPADWPVDVLRTDESGEVDVEQIEFNLSLSPAERMRQHYRWRRSVERLRGAGRAG